MSFTQDDSKEINRQICSIEAYFELRRRAGHHFKRAVFHMNKSHELMIHAHDTECRDRHSGFFSPGQMQARILGLQDKLPTEEEVEFLEQNDFGVEELFQEVLDDATFRKEYEEVMGEGSYDR